MATLDDIEASLPSEFDAHVYRELHADLREKTDEQLLSHYRRHGLREGRRSHSLLDRKAFITLIPPDSDTLEIGPFADPLMTGPRVRYFDVLDAPQLSARARAVGYSAERVPHVHFVSADGDLKIVGNKSCDIVLSSHVIEHQPDLISHLQAVENLLRPGGFYFLLVPDQRYCFDHFMAPSTIAELLDAHEAKRKLHTLKSIIGDIALTTHNDARRHWRGDHGAVSNVKARITRAFETYRNSNGKYVDVHAWYFDPGTFRDALALLRDLGLTGLVVSRIYPTLSGNNEFWAVLRATPC
jgi:predicted SAM-dependent methyltransferase